MSDFITIQDLFRDFKRSDTNKKRYLPNDILREFELDTSDMEDDWDDEIHGLVCYKFFDSASDSEFLVYYLNDVLVAFSMQDYEGNDVKFYFVDKHSADSVEEHFRKLLASKTHYHEYFNMDSLIHKSRMKQHKNDFPEIK